VAASAHRTALGSWLSGAIREPLNLFSIGQSCTANLCEVNTVRISLSENPVSMRKNENYTVVIANNPSSRPN
jgi:hypothetical protein